ncbi:ABC transporter ATP-binding protein [Corynebacterium uterequi]|uniref:Fatty acid ABC transporter ATP-binding/permease protein n=1 Tax=Corynebacterium uterequi TaxID=1072256 RepID=A0A0G3HF92_9CORY|nr:ABC transporter ATP-binding protein [Corynebacterium uterequi]AKK11979.1 ABC-type multidrug transport system, ATPase and permease component [Corynebacterium uterequi]
MTRDNAQDMTEEELLALESTLSGDEWSGSAPRSAKNFWPSLLRLVGLLAPHKLRLGLVIVMLLAYVGCYAVAPLVLGRAMDVIFAGAVSSRLPAGATAEDIVAQAQAQGRDTLADMLGSMQLTPGVGIDVSALAWLVVVMVAIYAAASLLSWGQGFVLNAMVMDVVYALRVDVEAKLNALPLSYVDGQQRGDVLSRTTNDVDNVQQTLQQALSQALQSILLIIAFIVMMVTVSWQLAAVTMLSIPLTAAVVAIIGSRSQREFKTQWRATGQLGGHIEESFTGHEVITLFGRGDAAVELFDERNDELFRASARAQFLSGLIMPVMQFVSYLSYVAIAVLGGLKVAHGSISLGAATAFIQYSRQFNQPLGELGAMAQMVQSGVASAERVFELLDAPEEADDDASSSLPLPARGLVEFHDVDFSYSPDTKLIQGLSLRVEPGQTVAIVGPTGAGKTTLVNLIMRFYELDAGRITIDGVDIRTLSRQQLRSQVGMVLQDAVLFDGTIRDNIRYGRLDASDDDVLAAAKASYVDRFVHALPDGYDTRIDADSGALSVGERQLITIARAFVARPALLILDEATSSVDTRTEVLVQEAMAALRADRTSFVIAHRLSTIRTADHIVVMENGQIVEQGRHEELLAAKGAYFRLYQAQFDAE